uniref:Transcriptional regulator n=1 Tax=Panagrellus redivivus TaxID=6233 RepID=A0A7E4ZVZ3_PANRE
MKRRLWSKTTDNNFGKAIDEILGTLQDAGHIQATYNYLVLIMNLPNERLVEYPLALRCSVAQIRRRHEVLKRVNKAIYDPELPGFVTLAALLQPSDKKFAERVARIRVEDYNRFLKTL